MDNYIRTNVGTRNLLIPFISQDALQKSDIVAILDMDGFQIGGKFFFKELGLLKVGSKKATSYFFDISLRWDALTAKDKRTCGYVIRNIHKLPFGVPRGWKAMPLEQLPAIKLQERRDPSSIEQ